MSLMLWRLSVPVDSGLAKRVGARILIASTSEVYGDPEVHPQPESYWGHVNPIGKGSGDQERGARRTLLGDALILCQWEI